MRDQSTERALLTFIKSLFGGALGLLTATTVAATNLNYAHFMPPASWQQQEIFIDWADAVKEASGGELSVKIFPAQTLGKAPQGYDNAINGIADIAWTVQGYTAGRFPLSHIIELPGLFERGEVGSCAFQKLYDSGALDEEYAETHVLFVHTHGPGHIFTRGDAVASLDDIANLKIRRPTAVIGKLLTELGAEPVGLPAPLIFEQLQRGTIDGYMFPWEAVDSFNLGEVTANHTEFGFYSLAFVTTMNKKRYAALSANEKAAIDANSGMKWALIAGKGYDKGDVRAKATLKSDVISNTIADSELAAWEAAAERATTDYLAELDGKGLPGTETYEQIKAYVTDCQDMLL